MIKKISIIIFALSLILGLTSPTAFAIGEEAPADRVKNSASNFTEIPRETNASMALRLCPTPQALTCIESVSAIYSDGSLHPFTLVDVATDTFLDQKNQKVENAWMQWSFIDNTGATRLIGTYGSLSGENYKGEQVNFNLQPKLTFSFLPGANGIKNEDVTSGIKFKFVFRSSWVVPVASFMMAANGEFLDEKISNGHRYTYIGSPFLGVNFSGPLGGLTEKEAVKTKSSSEEIRMYFLIDHASSIPNGSYVDTKCAKYGYPVTSHNAFGGGVPHLTDQDTLAFEIFSPHLLSTGELNKGFFTTDMSVAYMDCFWPGNNVTKSPKVEISVINSDGTVQLATTSVRITKDKIFQVRAFGFHYSRPIIRIKVVQANKIIEDVQQDAAAKAAADKAAADKAAADKAAADKAAADKAAADKAAADKAAADKAAADKAAADKAAADKAAADKAAADKAAADKAAADKAAADKAAADKAAADKAAADKAAADKAAKPIVASKKKTVTCTKGKVTKKIAGTNPKCPTGFKTKASA